MTRMVNVRRLDSVLAAHGFNQIDLLSVDDQGSGLSVPRSLDFETDTAKVTAVENNDRKTDVLRLLRKHGFIRVLQLEVDDFYLLRDHFLEHMSSLPAKPH